MGLDARKPDFVVLVRLSNDSLVSLFRLWAEIFRVHGSGDYMQWERVSEDVVPINISCVEDTPKTVFQVTAYNRHVEKIFDVRIIQPGIVIILEGPTVSIYIYDVISIIQNNVNLVKMFLFYDLPI